MPLKKNERWLARGPSSGFLYSISRLILRRFQMNSGHWCWSNVHSDELDVCAAELALLLPKSARLKPGEGPIKVRIEITRVED